MEEQDGIRQFQYQKASEILKYVNVENQISNDAKKLAHKLNKEIDKGNDTSHFIIALLIAAFKDSLDALVTLAITAIQVIPVIGQLLGISFDFIIFPLFGFFVSIVLYLLLKKNTTSLKAKLVFWILNLLSDLPYIQVLPLSSISVLYTWHVARKRRNIAMLKLANLKILTKNEIDELNNDIETLDNSSTENFSQRSFTNIKQGLDKKINQASIAQLRNNLKIEQKKTGIKQDFRGKEDQIQLNKGIKEENLSPRNMQIAQASVATLRNQQKIASQPQNQKNIIVQEAQKEREGIINNVLTSGIVSNGINLIPFVGGGKMMIEAIAGKELGGRRMTGKERIIHGAVGASSMFLDFVPGAGDIEREGFLAGKSVSSLEGGGASLAKKGATKSANLLSKTAKFMEAHPELTKKAEEYADEKIKEKAKEMRNYREGERSVQNKPLAA